MVGLAQIVGQIGPKWDKSGAFSDQISVHLAPNLTHFGAKPTTPEVNTRHPVIVTTDVKSGPKLRQIGP